MADCSTYTTPLQRSGTSQDGRGIPALSASSVEIIDKTPEDWMVWAGRLASRIRFHDLNNQVSGNFEPLFTRDLVARLAAIATHPADALPDFYREHLEVIEHTDVLASLQDAYSACFDVLLSYLAVVDRQYTIALQTLLALENDVTAEDQESLLAPVKEYCTQLEHHILLRLVAVLKRAVGYHKASGDEGLLSSAAAPELDLFHTPAGKADAMLASGFSAVWYGTASSWNNWESGIDPDKTLFGTMPRPAEEYIQHAARHHFFTGLLDEATASAAYLIGLAKRTINRLLENWPYHPPQYALYLAWLRLMEYARADINALTGRHLDFYYGEVLRMRPWLTVADSAHLAIELAKTTTSHALKQGTAFSAGKDASGNTITFAMVKNVVLNKASLDELRAVYVHEADPSVSKDDGRVYAAPVINSSDGEGAKLESELGEWHPFFIKQNDSGGTTSVNMPEVDLGFAVTSHFLCLKEGKRQITIRLAVSDVDAFLTHADLQAWVTTEKGWLEVDAMVEATAGTLSGGGAAAAVVVIDIAGDQPAVTAYDQDVHGHTFTTTDPVLKFVLRHDAASEFPYRHLLGLTLAEFELKVSVGQSAGSYNSEGITELEVHNDLGRLNPAKPFKPFGTEPTVGNSFVIGCEEVARKAGASVQLNMEWKDLPEDASDLDFDYVSTTDYHSIPSTDNPSYSPKVDIAVLEGGNWTDKVSGTALIGNTSTEPDATRVLSMTLPVSSKYFLERDDEYAAFSSAAKKGFMRLRLRNDFGHRNYRNALTYFLIQEASGNGGSQPAPPYEPVLQALHLSYSAACHSDVLTSASAQKESADARLLHVGPFGDAEQFAASAGAAVFLLPQVARLTGSTVYAQGEWYLGFSNVEAGESLSILIQLQEGSENPRVDPPDEHVTWSYLSANDWKAFDDNLQDGTGQLIRSGLVEFAVPSDATTDNTILPTGFFWIKASVDRAPDAVCRVLGVHANAVEVQRTSVDAITADTASLAAGSISKLATPQSAVRKVSQPYPTVGGRAVESSAAYRLRVSERLRHKDRAITIWDYERLVLQAFPEIYQVKCLNHTRISGSTTNGTLVYNEVAPGHVSIITIPDLTNRTDADPLKPYTKVSVLDSIKAFLRARTSCHVQLHTAQPQFEEVRLACRVVLRSGYLDAMYYEELLQQEVTEFLSPWAYGGSDTLAFGGSVHKSVLIDFIEERSYVDFITNVRMYHTPGEDAVEGGDTDEVIASTARSILVSAAAAAHEFEVETASSTTTQSEQCDE